MQFILDNLAAVLVYTAVGLALAATQINSSKSTVESTVAYMSKKQTLELGATIEQELKLIGQGTPNTLSAPVTNADGQTTSFTFWRNNGVMDIQVEYRLVETDVVSIRGEQVQRYRMDRYENGVLQGGSSSTLRDFVIEPLDAGGNMVGAGAAVLIRARIRDTYPLGDPDDMYIGQSVWGVTIHPENL